MTQLQKDTEWLKNEAKLLGFDQCGIAKAGFLENDARRFDTWLAKDFHGKMSYMERNIELRLNPQKLVPGAKTVITFLKNYYSDEKLENSEFKISKYAFGEDYHEVIREKLNELLFRLREKFGAIEGRGFVDSAPVLERSWAVESGLGWVGKNGNLITKKQGSYFFIATLIVDKEFYFDQNFKTDYCGTCTKCIDACPTDAILPNKEINGSQCISYFTIELKDEILNPTKNWNDWIFGCDVCQEVCPWNRFAEQHNEPKFSILNEIKHFSNNNWIDINEETFKTVFKNSPIKRTKWNGLKRNINFIKPK
ncbi:MAG: tRNA epoxyqueuosine(34) reductase QueG [Chitinophagaceae bacterium]|nr:tRNA epoxyqueuosine(34) reductase QueG [Chitinophagaceae bacterium]